MEQNFQCMQKKLTGENGVMITSDSVYSFPTHTHVYYEMTCYDAFDGEIILNDTRIPMNDPAIILVTPADFHRIRVFSAGHARFIKAAFDENLLSPSVRSRLPGPFVLRPMKKDGLPHLLFQELYQQRSCPEDALSLIHSLCFYLSRYGAAIDHSPKGKHHERIIQAIRIINQNFCDDISLIHLAGALGLSPQYLSTLFSQIMGITFSEYVQSLRLRRAAEMLRETDLQATEICFQCGFRNFSHFIRSFKKHYGASPAAYGALYKK